MKIVKKTLTVELWDSELVRWNKAFPELTSEIFLSLSDDDPRTVKILKDWELLSIPEGEEVFESITSIEKLNSNLFKLTLYDTRVQLFRDAMPSKDEMKNL